MKKAMLMITVIIVIILEAFTLKTYAVSLDAKTDYNVIDISLTTESGIVRGMSATFELTGEVSFGTFQWADEFKNINLKRAEKTEKTLTVYITPGDKSTFAIDGRIHIGTITLLRYIYTKTIFYKT